MIYRLHRYRGHKGETKAFTWTEYRELLIAAHRQLPGGNIVLIWDNLNVHTHAELRAKRPPPHRLHKFCNWLPYALVLLVQLEPR